MPIGATMSEGSSGENIQHFAGIRMRVVGGGLLKMKVYSMDNIKTKDLVAFTLTSQERVNRYRIVNFVEQRASFEIWDENLDEWFRINRISVYLKEIYTSHPNAG